MAQLPASHPLHCAALLLLAAGVAAGATFQVDRLDDPNPPQIACDPAVAGDCSLRGAILRANDLPDADLVQLGAGIHVLTIPGTNENGGATGDLDLVFPVEIAGAGTSLTWIDAGGIDRVLHVIGSGGGQVLLRDLRITGGDASGIGGGGILCSGLPLELLRVRVTGNTTSADGGGIRTSTGCDLHVARSSIDANDAEGSGGGIAAQGALVLEHATVSSNVGGEAGGVYALAQISALGSTIEGNLALPGDGGGILARRGVELEDSAVRGNEASNVGGGLYVLPTGGAVLVSIRRAELSGNQAGASGGGATIVVGAATSLTVELENATLSGNSAPNSAGVRTAGPLDLSLRNSTFSGQTGDGVGLHTTITTLAMAGNVFDDPCAMLQGTNELSLGGNLETGGDTCRLVPPQDAFNVSPSLLLLGALLENGGNTLTHRLGGASIALGFAPVGQCPPRDQRGAARGPGDCDSGAFELVPGFLFFDDFESGTDAAWSEVQP